MSVKEFLKREAVAVIAAAAALISCLFVPVTNYAGYIDVNILGILFCLMAVVAGFGENNVLKVLSERTVKTVKDTRLLAAMLIFTVFFISMFITNDVALIAFVPFSVMIYEKLGKSPVYVIVLQTVAANLGSAFTPFGNPQNLLLFTLSGMTGLEFFGITAQITGISFVMLAIAVLFVKKEPITIENSTSDVKITYPKYLVLYGILFVLCILSVFKVIDIIYVFSSVCLVVAILQPNIYSKVDYGLLVTFACFFIFVGNLKNIPAFSHAIYGILDGNEFECSLILSQVISNVPAAVMLSGFTEKYRLLILGTDIGGLGTLIASLASLISYKNYLRAENADSKAFIRVFTAVNLIFLIILTAYAKFFIIG